MRDSERSLQRARLETHPRRDQYAIYSTVNSPNSLAKAARCERREDGWTRERLPSTGKSAHIRGILSVGQERI